MTKKKLYIFRVTHPDHSPQTVAAKDADGAIFKSAKAWGLGRDWARAAEDAVALRIGEVEAG